MDSLPNELLIEILLVHNLIAFKTRSTRCWVKLMRVCRRWRDLGISTPCLWQTIEVTRNSRGLELALERSAHLPLDVLVNPEAIPSEYGALLTPHSHRLRSLILPPECEGHDSSVLHLLRNGDTPLLQRLELPKYPYEQHTLNLERLPSLRFLTTAHSRLSFPRSPSAPLKLRRLSLSSCFVEGPLDEFLHMLSTCVDLEELQLRYLESELESDSESNPDIEDSEQLPDISPRAFPRLRHLSIIDQPDESYTPAQLLSAFLITAPFTLKVIQWVDFDPDEPETLSDAFVDLLPQDRSKLSFFQEVTEGTIDCYSSSQEAKILCHNNSGSSIELVVHSDFLDLSEDGLALYLNCALSEFRTIFAGARLRTLTISGDHGTVAVDGDSFCELFSAFPTLRTLEIAGAGSPLAFLRSLAHPSLHSVDAQLESDSDSETESNDDSEADEDWGTGDNSDVEEGTEDKQEAEESDGWEDGRIVLPALTSLSLQTLDWEMGTSEALVAALYRRHARGLPRLKHLTVRLSRYSNGGRWGAGWDALMLYRREIQSLVTTFEYALVGIYD
ncbi:hypothetical protein C8Q76DRAFT_69428 [Earliella scabrosa]|nr:hypothetical protein C8Q76DRAFT_69428 [Earliella scabrosa]